MEQISQASDPLVTFCNVVVSRHGKNWPPAEDKLAEEFAAFFQVEPSVFESLLKLCETLGVGVSLAPLPEGHHGINGCHGSRREILLSEKETFPGGKEHTLLHELRELIEYAFCDLGFPTAKGHELEIRAEHFAISVRTDSGMKVWGLFLKDASTVEVNWKRWLAYAAVCVFGFAFVVSCAMHPYWEDVAMRAKRARQA